VRAIAVRYGKKKVNVGHRLSENERQWLAYEIKRLVEKFRGR
jgi:hypothetical protein